MKTSNNKPATSSSCVLLAVSKQSWPALFYFFTSIIDEVDYTCETYCNHRNVCNIRSKSHSEYVKETLHEEIGQIVLVKVTYYINLVTSELIL